MLGPFLYIGGERIVKFLIHSFQALFGFLLILSLSAMVMADLWWCAWARLFKYAYLLVLMTWRNTWMALIVFVVCLYLTSVEGTWRGRLVLIVCLWQPKMAWWRGIAISLMVATIFVSYWLSIFAVAAKEGLFLYSKKV